MKLKQTKMQIISFSLVAILIFTVIVPVLGFDVGAENNSVLLENNEEIAENNQMETEINNINIENENNEETNVNVAEQEVEDDNEANVNAIELETEYENEGTTENVYNLQPVAVNETIEIAPMALNILPPGSTSGDLQTAIDNATSGDTITISSDMQFSGSVTIPAGKIITIESNSNNNWKLIQNTSVTRHILVYGTLTLQNITLDGNALGGGIGVYANGTLNLNNGAIIQNNVANVDGGGIYVYSNGTFNINEGAIIQNNKARFRSRN